MANILIVHQNFPGQFVHIADALLKRGDKVAALGGKTGRARPGIDFRRWNNERGSTKGIFDPATRAEADMIRGIAAANVAMQLKRDGFTPDIIIGHPGWGETIFLKEIWPDLFEENGLAPAGMADDDIRREAVALQLHRHIGRGNAADHVGLRPGRRIEDTLGAAAFVVPAAEIDARSRAARLAAQRRHLVAALEQGIGDMDELAGEILVDDQNVRHQPTVRSVTTGPPGAQSWSRR